MISDVVISGYLDKLVESDKRFRYILTTSIDSVTQNEKEYRVPLLYWSRDKDNILIKSRTKSVVIVKGRIESDETIGLYVLVESMQICK